MEPTSVKYSCGVAESNTTSKGATRFYLTKTEKEESSIALLIDVRAAPHLYKAFPDYRMNKGLPHLVALQASPANPGKPTKAPY